MRLLHALESEEQALHTAVDDLESFVWVLVWSLVYIFKKVANILTKKKSKIDQLGRALSSCLVPLILSREYIAKEEWKDKIFKDLIQE
jgi:hypothetical protein